MLFDEKYVERYLKWFKTPEGAFAFEVQRRLLAHMVSTWPRRGQTLLDAGCGPGLYLESLWEAGFDVSGLDSSPAMLKAARSRLGKQAELHLGSVEHMPFDDNEFDFVVILTVLEFCDSPEKAVEEAVRVARKGVIIGFLNRFSLYYLSHGRQRRGRSPASSLVQAHWFSPGEVLKLLDRTAGRKPYVTRSVLPGPKFTWRRKLPWRIMNIPICPSWLGAFAMIRYDLTGDRAKTPLMAFKTEPKPS